MESSKYRSNADSSMSEASELLQDLPGPSRTFQTDSYTAAFNPHLCVPGRVPICFEVTLLYYYWCQSCLFVIRSAGVNHTQRRALRMRTGCRQRHVNMRRSVSLQRTISSLLITSDYWSPVWWQKQDGGYKGTTSWVFTGGSRWEYC